jgi:hypothetical protein
MLAKPAVVLTLLFLLLFSNRIFGQAETKPQLRTDDESVYTLPAGTVIRVKMDNGIDSGSANVDDTFTTTVSAPVIVRSVEVIPAGTVIQGRIVKVSPAKRGGMAGTITVAFENLKLPSGATRKIAADLGALNDETAAYGDDKRTVQGSGSGTESVTVIAGGAGAGAVVGGLVRGGSGAALGGALGAGAGILASYFRKGGEAMIKSNAELGILLKQSVTLPATDY